MEDAVPEGEGEGEGGAAVGVGAVAVATVVPVCGVASRLHPSPITPIATAAVAPATLIPLSARSRVLPRREHPIIKAYQPVRATRALISPSA